MSHDDDFEDDESPPPEKKHSPDTTDRKKQTHLRCERQRREAICNGYSELKELLPTSLSSLGCKTTNASILFRACDYIQQLESERDKRDEELDQLHAQKEALEVIAVQYEQMTSSHMPGSSTAAIDADAGEQNLQWKMFRRLMDIWFESFSAKVDTSNYPALARSLLSWVENEIDFNEVPSELAAVRHSSG